MYCLKRIQRLIYDDLGLPVITKQHLHLVYAPLLPTSAGKFIID